MATDRGSQIGDKTQMVQRSLKKHGNLFPEPYNLLIQTRDGKIPVFSREYTMAHPFTIYTGSLNDLISNFKRVLDELEPLMKPPAPGWDAKRLLEAQKELLSQLASHTDAAYLILKALSPPPALPINTPSAEDWLLKYGHLSVGNFKSAISAHAKERIFSVWNRLKHNAQKLSFVTMTPEGDDSKPIPGYWLVGTLWIDSKGVLGPDPDIHPDRTAFSFNRDLKLNLWYVYSLGKHLAIAIRSVLDRTGAPAEKSDFVEVDSTSIAEVVRRIAALPYYFFFDETKKAAVPIIQYDEARHALLADKTQKRIRPQQFSSYKLSSLLHVDPVSNGAVPPYFQPQPPPALSKVTIG
jgi:hypothetical protein